MSTLNKERKATAASAALRTDYKQDIHAWALEQIELLKAGRVAEIDALNIAEELQDVSERQYNKLESALAIILLHMLKWDHQPERRSRSWQDSIKEHRRRAEKQVRRYPSLKTRLGEAVEEAYESARSWCQIETHIPEVDFPFSCPYDWAEIMTRPFVYEDEHTKR
ncbi:MAG: hypothetical protein QOC72_3415 [Methylobacteriaceae bacterium]|nr:hypothetical protein [Methylobacteriaceae bacterium]